MNWNKEKAVFVASCVLCGLVAASTAKSWLASRDGAMAELSEPRAAGDSKLRTTLELPWFRMTDADGPRRNPYESHSAWRSAPPDPLAEPPLASLARRVPLPATLADAKGARPLREAHPPANRDEPDGAKPEGTQPK